MNSIARPRRTELSALADRFTAGGVATALATVMLSIVLISFRPFVPESTAGAGGDIVNQLGYGALGAASLFAVLTLVDRRVAAALPSPWWLLLIGCFLLSVVNAADPASALRTASFTLIGVMTVAAVVTLPRDAEGFSTVLTLAGALTIGLSYAGLVLLPDIAMHGADSFEPQHAGLWRGVFSHKNIAGPVMACLGFAGLYLWRRGRSYVGSTMLAAAMFFMLQTGSKTTAGLVPLAIVMVMIPCLVGMRALAVVLFAAVMAVAGLATVGTVFFDPLRDLSETLLSDPTYTGRTALWEFSAEMIARRPWTGYGYESFWRTPFIYNIDQPFDRLWDIRRIVHGHNGYLDIAVLMGVPTLIVATMTFLVVPMLDYLRTPPLRENVLMADLFMMILQFTALNALLESFFFRRADPVWLLLVMATIGLRMVARFPVPRASAA